MNIAHYFGGLAFAAWVGLLHERGSWMDACDAVSAYARATIAAKASESISDIARATCVDAGLLVQPRF